MLPMFPPGTHVIGFRWFFRISVGDVMILHDPRDGKLLLKRVTKIKKGAYFVQGDNTTESTDSRIFGWIKRTAIIAKVLPL